MNLLAPITLFIGFIKRIFGSPTVKAVLYSPYFQIFAIVLVIVLIGFLVYKIRKRKKAANPEEPAPELPEEEPPMPTGALLSIWKTYIRKIPAEFRRAILLYHPFAVLGDAGSGKSTVINTYSDWQNQSDQFYPSHRENQELQIYQGSKVIIQELSPAVLENTTLEVRNALVKLWKAFFKREDITAVVTVQAEDLLNENREGLISQAQIIRGKLNVLSGIMKTPVPVHLTVTFMDKMTGFLEYASFAAKKGMAVHVDYHSETDLSQEMEQRFDTHLTPFLISEPSGDYLKLLAYLNRQPELCQGIEKFISVLLKDDPLADAPTVEKVFFTSSKIQDTVLSNPFHKKEKQKRFWQKHPYFKHQVAASVLLVLGTFYLGFSHSYKSRYISDLKEKVVELQQKISISSEKKGYLEDLMDQTNAIRQDEFLALLMDFHPEAEHQIRATVLSYIRNNVLSTELDKLRKGGGSYEEVRMMLALIYASRDNQLGKLILDNLDMWRKTTGFTQKFMANYIQLSDKSWAKHISLADLEYEKKSPKRGYRELKVFINNVQDVKVSGFLTRSAFDSLQADARRIFERLRATPQAGMQDMLIPMLNEETVLDLAVFGETVDQKNEDRRLADFLYQFQKLDYDYPDPQELSLTQFFDNIEAMMGFKKMDYDKFPVEIDGTTRWLDLGQFHDITETSELISFIRSFITTYSYPGGLSFFTPGRNYQDLNAALSTENTFFFTAKNVIDGRYTKKTYDDEIKPPLDRVPALLDKLPVSEDEKHRLSSFIYREAEAYAQKYADEYKSYYSKFSIRADSLGELRFIINQILLPMSQFQEFMLTLKNNLDLEYGKSDYFKPIMMHLGSLGFMKIIMQNEKDFFPELEKYKSILRMMLTDLETDGSTIPAEPGSDTADLNRVLSPSARITLSIFRNDPGSYMELIQKWTKSVGVPENMGYAFMEPVYQVYRLGLSELNTQVVTLWSKIQTRHLGRDLELFPFNTTASKEADPQNILKLMKSDGDFWTQFKMFIAPLCKKVNGRWEKREFEMGSITLPDSMLDAANRLTHLSGLLVNEKNEPQPLLVDIKADILPRIENRLQFVILTYLQSDTSAVYGFNQRPSWETFKINWWKESQSSIGVEFSSGDENQFKIYRNDTIPNSYWSFYRLLQKAEFDAKKNAWTWAVDSPENINWKRSVTFFMKQNPFLVFNENRIDQ
ncbi:MAG: type VI secretion protein IcmF/TssM N-terminal domain-containing protein [Desulfobacter sp.]